VVPAGTKSISVPYQSGTGTVEYYVLVNEENGWSVSVLFTN